MQCQYAKSIVVPINNYFRLSQGQNLNHHCNHHERYAGWVLNHNKVVGSRDSPYQQVPEQLVSLDYQPSDPIQDVKGSRQCSQDVDKPHRDVSNTNVISLGDTLLQ